MQANQPIEFAIYYGSSISDTDTPETYQLADAGEVEAFFRGIEDADGWMDCSFLPHSGYYVDKDEEISERRGAHAQPQPNERYVIWGEHPEPGTRAQREQFDTPGQAQAYETAASDMVGWTTHSVVPSADFKPLADFPACLEEPSTVPEPLRQQLLALVEQDEVFIDDVLFVRDDGAFVDTQWSIGQPISNEPVSPAQWRERFLEFPPKPPLPVPGGH